MAWNNEEYYSSPEKRIGKEGDFYTNPLVHPAFGWALARQIAQMWGILEQPAPFTILEFGGGNDKLAGDILDYLERHYLLCYKAATYLISDYPHNISCSKNQYKLIPPFNPNFPNFKFTGVVLAHEFLDALPVHRVIMREEGLREIMVSKLLNGQLEEIEENISTPLIKEFFSLLKLHPLIGCQGEVNLETVNWLKWISQNMEQGFICTIDYGDLAEDLFTKERCHGTIRGISRHQLTNSLYDKPGKQDLTSHVNFSSIIASGKELGVNLTGFTLQSYFLLGLELLSLVKPEDLTTVKRLILPGMGGAYKILIQHKNCSPSKLSGLSMRSLIPHN